jgi:putative endonuclease
VPQPGKAESGRRAEDLACDHLRRHGLRLLERNYRTPRGELDLVLDEGGTLVFVEVRYRADERFGTPAETVDTHKQRKLRAAAEHYLLARGGSTRPARFDIVALSGPLERARIEWLRDVF